MTQIPWNQLSPFCKMGCFTILSHPNTWDKRYLEHTEWDTGTTVPHPNVSQDVPPRLKILWHRHGSYHCQTHQTFFNFIQTKSISLPSLNLHHFSSYASLNKVCHLSTRSGIGASSAYWVGVQRPYRILVQYQYIIVCPILPSSVWYAPYCPVQYDMAYLAWIYNQSFSWAFASAFLPYNLDSLESWSGHYNHLQDFFMVLKGMSWSHNNLPCTSSTLLSPSHCRCLHPLLYRSTVT